MTKLDTSRLKMLTRQLTQGVIGEIEFVAALRVPEPVAAQIDQLLTLPKAAHRRVKIEDLSWPKQLPVDDEDWGDFDVGSTRDHEDDDPKIAPKSAKVKSPPTKKPVAQRNLEFFERLGTLIFGATSKTRRTQERAAQLSATRAKELAAQLAVRAVGDELEPDLEISVRQRSLAQLIHEKILGHTYTLPAQDVYSLTIDAELLCDHGLSIPPVAGLLTAARSYDNTLKDFIYEDGEVSNDWEEVPVAWSKFGQMELFHFEFPTRDIAAEFAHALTRRLDKTRHASIEIIQLDHVYQVKVPDSILFHHDLVPPKGVAEELTS